MLVINQFSIIDLLPICQVENIAINDILIKFCCTFSQIGNTARVNRISFCSGVHFRTRIEFNSPLRRDYPEKISHDFRKAITGQETVNFVSLRRNLILRFLLQNLFRASITLEGSTSVKRKILKELFFRVQNKEFSKCFYQGLDFYALIIPLICMHLCLKNFQNMHVIYAHKSSYQIFKLILHYFKTIKLTFKLIVCNHWMIRLQ